MNEGAKCDRSDGTGGGINNHGFHLPRNVRSLCPAQRQQSLTSGNPAGDCLMQKNQRGSGLIYLYGSGISKRAGVMRSGSCAMDGSRWRARLNNRPPIAMLVRIDAKYSLQKRTLLQQTGDQFGNESSG